MTPEAAAARTGIEPEIVEPDRSVADERQAWHDAVVDLPLADGTTESVATYAGVPCRWVQVTTDDDAGRPPVIVYVHGGGFLSGSSVTHRSFASRLALRTGCSVLLVDYRLLPEHSFPAPIDDVVTVVTELVESVGIGVRRIVLAGDSSGAAISIGAAAALRDAGGPVVSCIISLSGAFDATLSGASIDSGRDPQLSREVLEHWQQTVRAVTALDDPMVSPVFADLGGLPPVLLLAGGDEVWLDDSREIARLIAEAGGHCALHVFDDMWHVWPMWGDFPEALDALDRVATFITIHTGH
jgi:monoterpene epsilon-lactone hydrolase